MSLFLKQGVFLGCVKKRANIKINISNTLEYTHFSRDHYAYVITRRNIKPIGSGDSRGGARVGHHCPSDDNFTASHLKKDADCLPCFM